MPELTDTQALLLSTAAQRSDGSLLPPPSTLGTLTDRIRKAVETLVRRTLAQEAEVTGPDRAWRSDGETHWGAVITDAGRKAIGIELSEAPEEKKDLGADAARNAESKAEPALSITAVRQTKAAIVLELLRREQGATLAELIEATDWLPHTTRAALTGLRKKGHSVDRGKRNEATCYTVAGAARP